MKNIFVFVVCGAKEHIDTLHFSLGYLQKYSQKEIWVLTDAKRNEIPIQHDHVIDIETPKDFDHHQASIYLKTGIHKFLPKGHRYCYLDTDVIALDEKVDLIFKEYQAPITFAPDHCKMDQFSAFAVNCECIDLYDGYFNRMENELLQIDPLRQSTKPSIVSHRKKLVAFYTQHHSLFQKIKVGLRYMFSFKKFHISNDLYFDKKDKTWKDIEGEVFMHHFRWSKVSRACQLKWNFWKRYPELPDGRSLWTMTCDHLQQNIQEKFDIRVETNQFQHWNGGVFLFDDDSHDFLNRWFDKTMLIFQDPKWKTRDQGTLIATVWELGLQDHPMLGKQWNLIADYNNPFLQWESEDAIRIASSELIKPQLLHVYHHFGDNSWPFWKELMNRLNCAAK